MTLPDDIAPRQRGAPARPTRWNGVDYPSEAAALRAVRGIRFNPGPTSRVVLRRAVERGEAEYLPRRNEDASGPVGEARRILRAAREIYAQANDVGERADDGEDVRGERVSLGKRRKGLLKAMWRYYERHGRGVIDGAQQREEAR